MGFFDVVSQVKEVVSGELYIGLVLCVSIFFCILMRFPQIRFFKQSIRAVADDANSKDGISPFSAFATALGSRVGVGNIAGIASAISLGGPGAVFWIWVFGIFGSGLAIAESILGQIYKIKEGDEFLGGPAYYIRHMYGGKRFARFLSIIYAIVAIVCIGLFLSGVQTNTVVNSISNGLGVSKNHTVAITAVAVALIIWGGIKRIGAFEGVLTPLMIVLYAFFAIVVIAYYGSSIANVFYLIFSSAFGVEPLFGAIAGQAITMGVRRGVFSSDVGYGAGASFSSVARASHPVKQALLQGASVLISTFIICTLSAVILLSSDSFQVLNSNGGSALYVGSHFPGTQADATWVQAGMNVVPLLNGWAPHALAALVAFFATTSIVGNYYLMESNLRFLFHGANKRALMVMKTFYVVGMVCASLISSTQIWDFADIGLALLCYINLVTMVIASPKIVKVIKDYARAKQCGQTPTFDPANYGYKDTTGAWVCSEFEQVGEPKQAVESKLADEPE